MKIPFNSIKKTLYISFLFGFLTSLKSCGNDNKIQDCSYYLEQLERKTPYLFNQLQKNKADSSFCEGTTDALKDSSLIVLHIGQSPSISPCEDWQLEKRNIEKKYNPDYWYNCGFNLVKDEFILNKYGKSLQQIYLIPNKDKDLINHMDIHKEFSTRIHKSEKDKKNILKIDTLKWYLTPFLNEFTFKTINLEDSMEQNRFFEIDSLIKGILFEKSVVENIGFELNFENFSHPKYCKGVEKRIVFIGTDLIENE